MAPNTSMIEQTLAKAEECIQDRRYNEAYPGIERSRESRLEEC